MKNFIIKILAIIITIMVFASALLYCYNKLNEDDEAKVRRILYNN